MPFTGSISLSLSGCFFQFTIDDIGLRSDEKVICDRGKEGWILGRAHVFDAPKFVIFPSLDKPMSSSK